MGKRICPGCDVRELPLGHVGCWGCWQRVDRAAQDRVWATWANGFGEFTPEYRQARNLAVSQMQHPSRMDR